MTTAHTAPPLLAVTAVTPLCSPLTSVGTKRGEGRPVTHRATAVCAPAFQCAASDDDAASIAANHYGNNARAQSGNVYRRPAKRRSSAAYARLPAFERAAGQNRAATTAAHRDIRDTGGQAGDIHWHVLTDGSAVAQITSVIATRTFLAARDKQCASAISAGRDGGHTPRWQSRHLRG